MFLFITYSRTLIVEVPRKFQITYLHRSYHPSTKSKTSTFHDLRFPGTHKPKATVCSVAENLVNPDDVQVGIVSVCFDLIM